MGFWQNKAKSNTDIATAANMADQVTLKIVLLNDSGKPHWPFPEKLENITFNLNHIRFRDRARAGELLDALADPNGFENCRLSCFCDYEEKKFYAASGNFNCKVERGGKLVFERTLEDAAVPADRKSIPDQFWELLRIAKSPNIDPSAPGTSHWRIALLTPQAAGVFRK